MPFPTSVDPIVDAPPVTANTVIHASQVLGPQRITVGPVWINVKSDQIGAKGDGSTDDTAAINLAITTAGTSGIVFFPPGVYICSGVLNLASTLGMTLQGSGGRSGGAATATILRYTPSTGARFIDGRLSSGLCIRDMYVQANNVAFPGILIDLGPNPTQTDGPEVRNCTLVCQGSAAGSTLLNWDNIINGSAVSTLFSGSAVQIQLGVTNSCDCCKVTDCQFKYVVGGVAMQGITHGMVVDSTLFEFTNQNVTSTVINLTAGSAGVVFSGNESADSTGGSGTVISYAGSGFTSIGNRWGGAAAMTCLNFVSGAIGQAILGNQFNTFGTAVTFGAASGPVLYAGNQAASVTTEISGTPNRGSLIITGSLGGSGVARWVRAGRAPSLSTDAFATPYTPDFTAGEIHQVTLTGAITVNAPTGGLGGSTSGSEITFMWVQDGTGGRVVTYAAAYKLGTVGAMNTTASTVTLDKFITYDNITWYLRSRNTGM